MMDDAIRIVSQREGASMGAFLRSIALLAEPESDSVVPLSVIMTALRNSLQFGDNITPMRELAVLALYRRTGRPRKPGHVAYEDFIVDPDDWEKYLTEQGIIQPTPGGDSQPARRGSRTPQE